MTRAIAEVRRLRLVPHPDPPKNWDSLAALNEVLRRTSFNARILDAGAERYSSLLPWLWCYGYQNLIGINLAFAKSKTVKLGPITYEHGDLTDTGYTDGTFDAVTCLSVIEHAVDVQRYFAEMARIIKPGGLLVTSTDYFDLPTDTKGRIAFGVPIRIFAKQGIVDMFQVAKSTGFSLTTEVDLSCDERVVRWAEHELSYTFIVFAMVRDSHH